MRVINAKNGRPVSWGHMALREILIPMAAAIPLSILAIGAILAAHPSTNSNSAFSWELNAGGLSATLFILYYLYAIIWTFTDALWIFKGDKRQRLVDKFAKTQVINEAVEL